MLLPWVFLLACSDDADKGTTPTGSTPTDTDPPTTETTPPPVTTPPETVTAAGSTGDTGAATAHDALMGIPQCDKRWDHLAGPRLPRKRGRA